MTIYPLAQAQLATLGTAGTQSSSSSVAVVSRRLQGRVTNALDGAAVPRVLVLINNRTVLTDAQGHFEFPDFTDTQAFVTLTKPNFSQTTSSSPANTRQKIVNLDASIELKIYPDATITGTVVGRDGLPLSHVPVQLKRGVFDQNGWRWLPIHSVQTDLHGEYRFRAPNGRYQVVSSYVARSQDTGEAILPLQYPANTSSALSAYFEVQPGQEKRFDLRPKSGIAYPIQVRLDAPEAQRGVQFYAETSGGDAFQVPMQGSAAQGGMQLISLPTGTYTLYARLETKDVSMQGSTRVTVTGRQTDAAVIHLESSAVLPVELIVDSSNATTTTGSTSSTQPGQQTSIVQQPDLRQFNLRLHNLNQSGLPFTQDIMIRQNEQHAYEFRASPGRYRLLGAGGGTWWIESATSGVTNLMSSDIVISSGGSGAPVRIVASNAQGMVAATVRLPPDVDTGYLYLIPSVPSLSPVNPITVSNTGAGATTVSSRLPAGSYLAVALDHRIEADFHDPEVLSHFSSAAKTVAVSSSATANIDLDLAQETKP